MLMYHSSQRCLLLTTVRGMIPTRIRCFLLSWRIAEIWPLCDITAYTMGTDVLISPRYDLQHNDLTGIAPIYSHNSKSMDSTIAVSVTSTVAVCCGVAVASMTAFKVNIRFSAFNFMREFAIMCTVWSEFRIHCPYSHWLCRLLAALVTGGGRACSSSPSLQY